MLTRYLGIGLLVLAALFPSICNAQKQSVLSWTRGILWYQILIDRFDNGDTSNDPIGDEVLGDSLYQWNVSNWTSNWFDLSIAEQLYSPDFYPNAYLRQYGGDFEGIRNRLAYLKNLGVSALLLSPIFSATSSHKYDVNSLHHTSRSFGHRNDIDTTYINREIPQDPNTWYLTSSDRDFINLVQAVHDSGMKVVIDAQFVHVSPQFWAFADVLKKQERSSFGSWFTIRDWDKAETPFMSEFKYDALWGINAFPKFSTDSLGLSPGPKEYVLAATRRWMDPNGDGDPRDGIDGWRIVLASYLPDKFWNEWTALVKSINPQAVVIAEWNDPGGPAPTCFDIIYSHRFARGISGALITHSLYPTQFDDLVYKNVKSAKDPDAAINMVDDLETDRLASQCVNRNVLFESVNSLQKNPQYLVRKPNYGERRLQKQSLALQFVMTGSPMIYYGDECGMWGADDPGSRKPMVWYDSTYEDEISVSVNGDEAHYPVLFDSSIFRFYQELINLREKHLALKYGSMQTLVIDDEKRLYAFKRESGSDRIWVVMNCDDISQECSIPMREVTNGTRIIDPLQALNFLVSKGRLSITVPPRTVSVLLPAW